MFCFPVVLPTTVFLPCSGLYSIASVVHCTSIVLLHCDDVLHSRCALNFFLVLYGTANRAFCISFLCRSKPGIHTVPINLCKKFLSRVLSNVQQSSLFCKVQTKLCTVFVFAVPILSFFRSPGEVLVLRDVGVPRSDD